MDYAGAQIIVDPTVMGQDGSETVVLLHDGLSLTPEQIASLLQGLPNQLNQAKNTTSPQVISISSSNIQSAPVLAKDEAAHPIDANKITPATQMDQNDSLTNVVHPSTGKRAKSKKKTPPKPRRINKSPKTPNVLSTIDPNLLTPDSSPVVSEKNTPNITPIRVKIYPSNNILETPEANGEHIDSWTELPSVQSVVTKTTTTDPNVKPVGTLVFFDLETTGLGHQIGKSNVHITEISMVAFDRKEFWLSNSSDLKDIRIIQKLSMCIRPRTSVSAGAAKVTGLDHFNLIDQYPFDKNVVTTITSFLSHLPKPVCLLAHNGNCYDFPLLKAEFKRLSVQLPSDLLIADTLSAFKSIGIAESPPDRKICKSVKYGRTGRLSHSLENLHLFFFNKKPTGSHSSEGDCIALAKVCHKLKNEAIPWIEANTKTFDDVQPMW